MSGVHLHDRRSDVPAQPDRLPGPFTGPGNGWINNSLRPSAARPPILTSLENGGFYGGRHFEKPPGGFFEKSGREHFLAGWFHHLQGTAQSSRRGHFHRFDDLSTPPRLPPPLALPTKLQHWDPAALPFSRHRHFLCRSALDLEPANNLHKLRGDWPPRLRRGRNRTEDVSIESHRRRTTKRLQPLRNTSRSSKLPAGWQRRKFFYYDDDSNADRHEPSHAAADGRHEYDIHNPPQYNPELPSISPPLKEDGRHYSDPPGKNMKERPGIHEDRDTADGEANAKSTNTSSSTINGDEIKKTRAHITNIAVSSRTTPSEDSGNLVTVIQIGGHIKRHDLTPGEPFKIGQLRKCRSLPTLDLCGCQQLGVGCQMLKMTTPGGGCQIGDRHHQRRANSAPGQLFHLAGDENDDVTEDEHDPEYLDGVDPLQDRLARDAASPLSLGVTDLRHFEPRREEKLKLADNAQLKMADSARLKMADNDNVVNTAVALSRSSSRDAMLPEPPDFDSTSPWAFTLPLTYNTAPRTKRKKRGGEIILAFLLLCGGASLIGALILIIGSMTPAMKNGIPQNYGPVP